MPSKLTKASLVAAPLRTSAGRTAARRAARRAPLVSKPLKTSGGRRLGGGLARRQARRTARRTAPPAVAATGAFAAGVALTLYLDPQSGHRRRKMTAQKLGKLVRRTERATEHAATGAAAQAHAAAERAAHPQSSQAPPADDTTLARKVETEIFRPADAPKGSVVVDAYDGVVGLRGQVDTQEMIDRLVDGAAAIPGVRRVENLLHLPGTPAPDPPFTGGV